MSDTPPVRILGIETSCDETAASVVEEGREILSNAVASQEALHAQFGGIFPEVASRQHIQAAIPILEKALKDAHLSLDELDAIAVTRGPGLPGSLVVGINLAKGLALSSSLPLIGVNHLEGHLYSAWLGDSHSPPEFPLVALIVSGGHTELVLMTGHLSYQRLGGTLDDAAGEAFDKAARLLDLGYPGGPAIQKAAQSGNPLAFHFPRAKITSWDFSFSGLKTALLREVRGLQAQGQALPKADLAASFEAAVVEALAIKTIEAARTFQAKSIVVAGGVSANLSLRNQMTIRSPVPVHIPRLFLCTDNAAMIAAAGYQHFIRGIQNSLDFDALPNWKLSN